MAATTSATATWSELEARYYMHTFKRLPLAIDHGDGVYVVDADGKRYMDWLAGIAVNTLGHNHPALVGAITEQAKKLIHITNLFYTKPQLDLAALLCEHTGMERVFFANSGAEINEGAIKLARIWGKKNRGGAYEVITAMNSFHGRTLAMVAATGQPHYQEPYEPLPSGFTNVPYNDFEAIQAATTADTVAIMLEPIQGESGIHLADPQYLADVREWCDMQGLLLIFDEIQSGMGRTGHFLAAQGYGIEPDVITLAKALAGGVPIGALLARGSAAEAFGPGDHGGTFGGNPLACAAGVAVMRTLLEQNLMKNASDQGGYLMAKLSELRNTFPFITEVRGRGLMIAFDMSIAKAPALVLAAISEGLIVNATGPNTIRIVPPLILTRAQVDEGIAALKKALAKLEDA